LAERAFILAGQPAQRPLGLGEPSGRAQAKVADWLDVCGIDLRRDVALTVC
jgi:hypothetical protein